MTAFAPDSEYGLILHQDGKRQQALMRFLSLVLNYQYGLETVVARDLQQAASLHRQYGQSIRYAFVIQAQKMSDQAHLADLSRQHRIPLFLIVPMALVALQQRFCEGMENVYVHPWERVFSQKGSSLLGTVAATLEKNGIVPLLDRAGEVSQDEVRQRLERRLKHLHTLPALPEIVLRIMRLLNDPQSSTAALEEVVCSDTAIVWKLLQVMKSPVFAGAAHQGKWTLGEIIVRLGRRKVGAIAQQIAIINSLVRPEESEFDLRRFWQHSVGCALVADKLCSLNLLSLPAPLEFNDYWIGALLHDIGKLALGFFSWNWFEVLLNQMTRDQCSFRQAEAQFGDAVNHEYIGRLLLLHADMAPELVEVAGAHHSTPEAPSPLAALVHVADNLCKDLGLGCVPEEPAEYSDAMLQQLQLESAALHRLRESLDVAIVEEIQEMVDRCIQP